MFKNNVFKVSVSTQKWIKAAGVRAVRTMAQTAGAMIVMGQSATEVDWINVISVSVVAGVISVLTSVGGIPEVESEVN